MPIDPARVKALFQAAIDRHDPADRHAFLDREAGDDPELRARLDELLEAHERFPGTQDRPPDAVVNAGPTAPSEADPGSQPVQIGGDDGSEPALAGTGPTAGPRPPLAATADPGRTRTHQSAAEPLAVGVLIAGRYKLRQQIGEGGMGSVYLADQVQPVKRQVALKLIKAGMDSRTVLARFEAERQALALMDHPNIARVLDAGTTDQGRPFFVMELVKGIPLTDYCDQHRLDLPARLALFRQICSAVQHAHQKGIIHRDLKPTNILVESHDGKPVPKVIDFGLAKATSGLQLSENSLYTAFGAVAGTPLYMAPEQATFDAVDIDTRADIYALGVILYELLTGTTPIQRETLKRVALEEMLRVIREDEPPTPSSRLGSSESLPSLAASRHIEPTRLSRFVRGDLDWIVMKALAKERNRRYDSAIGLANDVERFLNHEPVTAGPPTARYRLGKFVRRNRGQVIAASLLLLALVGGVVGTSIGLFEARKQQRHAEKRLAQVAKMNEILGSMFKDLDPKRAERDGKPLPALLAERLDRAAAEIEGDATGDPIAVARMQMTLGTSLFSLDYPNRAITLFSRSRDTNAALLGPDHPDTLRSMGNLASSYDATGQMDQALKLREELLALFKSKLGTNHRDTLTSMSNLAVSYAATGQPDRALKLREETLALQKSKLGPDDPDTLQSMNNLATSYAENGQPDRALKLSEETLTLRRSQLGPDHPDTLQSMSTLALSYAANGQPDRALKLGEETLVLVRSKFGPDHRDTLQSMNNLANSYAASNQLERALKLREETLTLQRSKLGPVHPETLQSMNNLANSYEATGQPDRALKLREETLALQRSKFGPEHPNTLIGMINIALSYDSAGQFGRALKLREETLKLLRSKLGPDHPNTLISMGNLAFSYDSTGQADQSLKLREELLARMKSQLGPDHPDTLECMNHLAISCAATGQVDRALQLSEETLALLRSKVGPDHPYSLFALEHQAQYLANAGQIDRARVVLDELIVAGRRTQGDGHPETLRSRLAGAGLDLVSGRLDAAEAADREILDACRAKLGADDRTTIATEIALARVQEARGYRASAAKMLGAALESARKRPEDLETLSAALAESGRSMLAGGDAAGAEPLLREALALREANVPQLWCTADARSLVGGALLAQGKAAEAVPLLRSGYEGLARSAPAIPRVDRPRLAEALDRLIAAGEAAGQPEEIAAWRAARAKLDAPGPVSKPEAGAK